MVERQQNLDGLFSALSDATRRAIVARLVDGPCTVGELAEPFDISLAAVSKHLHILDRAGLIARKRNGRCIECTLNAAQLKPVADWITDYEQFWSDRLAKLEQVINDTRRRSP